MAREFFTKTLPLIVLIPLSQDHFQYDQETVLNTVLMGHTTMWNVMKEREVLYSKDEFSDADGIRVAELEEQFAEMGGYEAESDAAALLSGLGIKEDKHYQLMGELSGKEKVRVMLAKALFGNPTSIWTPSDGWKVICRSLNTPYWWYRTTATSSTVSVPTP